ncbi:MAG: hypothetical protein GF392_04460 [Candidatus Omnitrophica bacterium]|nr:hypothetical protein [Candidatus Omnitrophota bacterium]
MMVRGLQHTDHIEDAELRKKMECELPKLRRISAGYRRWWHTQIISLLVFIVSLVFSIIQSWWFLLPACISLGLSLYANNRRMDLGQRYRGIEEAVTAKETVKES